MGIRARGVGEVDEGGKRVQEYEAVLFFGATDST